MALPIEAEPAPSPDWLVRVWMDDRPGALGALAARIGAVGGNLVGIEILERGAGRVIDELVVTLDDPALLDLLVSEMQQVDGVDVESIRPVAGVAHDRHGDLLEVASVIVESPTVPAVFRSLCDGITTSFRATWVAVVDPAAGVLGGSGDRPADVWIAAFVEGSRSAPDPTAVEATTCVVTLEPTPFVAVVDRAGEPFRDRERRWLESLGRVAGAAVRTR